MKALLMTVITALAITATGFAGTAKDVVAPPTPTLSQWFVGGSIEYIDKADTELYTLKVGKRFFQTEKFSWALFGEVGLATEVYGSTDVDMIPITFNADARYNLTEALSVYAGAGIGTSYLDVKSDTDWYVTYQLFTGLAYRFDRNVEVTVGARYTWLLDTDQLGNVDSVSYGAGLTWYF